MHRTFITVALAASLGACTAGNGDEAILVTKNVTPGDGCTFVSATSEASQAHGTISAFSDSSYRLHPQMQSRVSGVQGMDEQRTIITKGAHVDITFADPAEKVGDNSLLHYDSLFSAPVYPNGGITDGAFDAVPLDLIKAIKAAKGTTPFRVELIVKSVVYGDMSGSDVTSQEFQYPVTVCSDCVVNILPAACPATMELANPGNSCNPYQDGTVDCCMTDETPAKLLCPAPVVTM